jgi:thiol-disulfide isomerase/thioredoxin
MKLGMLRAVATAVLAMCAGAASAVELRPFVQGSWQELRRIHAGRPTIVHFWGVTCGPCRIEMPEWGRLLRERPDMNLVLIDADLVPNEPHSVIAMLAKTGVNAAEQWIFDDDYVERLRYEIDPQWHGEIPYTIFISRDGTTTTVAGAADVSQVRAWLDAQSKIAPLNGPTAP